MTHKAKSLILRSQEREFLSHHITSHHKTIDEVFKELWLPYLDGLEKYPEYKIETEGACSYCLSLAGLTMERLKSLDEYDKNKDVTIFVGRKKENPEGLDPYKVILFDDCLKKFRGKGFFTG